MKALDWGTIAALTAAGTALFLALFQVINALGRSRFYTRLGQLVDIRQKIPEGLDDVREWSELEIRRVIYKLQAGFESDPLRVELFLDTDPLLQPEWLIDPPPPFPSIPVELLLLGVGGVGATITLAVHNVAGQIIGLTLVSLAMAGLLHQLDLAVRYLRWRQRHGAIVGSTSGQVEDGIAG